MRHREWRIAAPFLFAAVALPCALAAQARPAGSTDRGRVVKYVKRGAPVRRVSAGVRGHSEVALDRQVVALVAPHDHVAWTMREQPVLFWRFAGRRDQVARALLVVQRGSRVDSLALAIPDVGLQRIDLKGTPLRLARDVDYQWKVLVHRPDPSLPPESDEAWVRVVGPTTLATEPNDPEELAHAAAAVGLWYDAFAALTDACLNSPGDTALGASWSTFVSTNVRGLTPPAVTAREAR